MAQLINALCEYTCEMLVFKEEVWDNVRGKKRELIFCPTRAVESSAEGAERLYGNTQRLFSRKNVTPLGHTLFSKSEISAMGHIMRSERQKRCVYAAALTGYAYRQVKRGVYSYNVCGCPSFE